MAKNKKSPALNAADIKKYLDAEAVNRHEVEKKLMADPFASDALEGYEALKKDKIDEKAAQIDLKNRLNKRIAFNSKSRIVAWRNVSIAAAVIAIVGASYMFFGNFDKKETIQAVKLPPIEQPEETISDDVIAETPNVAKNKTENKAIIQTKDIAYEDVETAESLPKADYKSDKEEETILGNNTKVQESNEVAAAPVLAKAKAAYDMQVEKMSGTVTDADKQPVIGAIIKTKNGQSNTQTDAQGNFTILKDGDAAAIEISAIGYKTQEIVLENAHKTTIILTEDPSALSEIQVTRQKAKTVPEIVALQVTEPKPKMGWNNFDDLLMASVKQTGAVSTIRFDDPITVRIMVESSGKVSKVEVQSREISKEDSEKIAKTIETKTRWFPARKSGKKIRKQVSRQISPEDLKKE